MQIEEASRLNYINTAMDNIINAIKTILKPIYRWLRPIPSMVSLCEAFNICIDSDRGAILEVPTPRSESLPEFHNAYRKLRNVSITLDSDVTCILQGALYCPRNNVVMDSNKRIIKESKCGGKWKRYSRVYLDRTQGFVSGHCCLLQGPDDAYFHTIMDWIPRIIAITEPPYTHLDRITLLASTRLPSYLEYIIAKIAPSNVIIQYCAPDRLYSVDKLIFINYKNKHGYLHQKYLNYMRNALLPQRLSRRNRRILISRSNASHRRIKNFRALKEALRPYGFHTIRPEEMSIQDVIEIFYDAEYIIGTHGSGLTNIIFSEYVTIIELFMTHHMAPHFYLLSESLGHSYHYVMGTGDELFPEEYNVDIDAIMNVVRSMLESGAQVSPVKRANIFGD